MTDIIRYSTTGRKVRIISEKKISPLTLNQIQNCKYPECPISKTDIFKMDYEELKKFCKWKSQNMIISNYKKYLALCKKINILGSSGLLSNYDWRREHLRLYTQYCFEDDDEIEKQELYWTSKFMNIFSEQIREFKQYEYHMKPILVKRFTKDFNVIREYTYDYPAHWKSIGYKKEHWELREAKTMIAAFFKKYVLHI